MNDGRFTRKHHLDPLKKGEIISLFGTDKSMAGTVNGVVPLICENANSSRNMQITEFWRPPANDSAFNQSIAMDLPFFNAHLNLNTVVIYATKCSLHKTITSAGIVVFDPAGQRYANQQFLDTSVPFQTDETNPFLVSELKLCHSVCSTNLHTPDLMQVFDYRELVCSGRKEITYNFRVEDECERIFIKRHLIKPGFCGYLAVTNGESVVGTVLVHLPVEINLRAERDIEGLILGRTYQSTPFSLKDVENWQFADGRRYLHRRSLEFLYADDEVLGGRKPAKNPELAGVHRR